MSPGGRIEKDTYTQRTFIFDSNCFEDCSFSIWAAHLCSFSYLTSHVFWPIIIMCHFIMWYLWGAFNDFIKNGAQLSGRALKSACFSWLVSAVFNMLHRAVVTQEVEQVVHDSWLLQSTYRSVLGQNTESQITPDGCTSTLVACRYQCVCVNDL